jgi:hypothetical protein
MYAEFLPPPSYEFVCVNHSTLEVFHDSVVGRSMLRYVESSYKTEIYTAYGKHGKILIKGRSQYCTCTTRSARRATRGASCDSHSGH